ncbi:Sec-independent protein translocase protein TatC [subsurface metagenome]|jgi:sec-independent protein translocase protein TatC
MEESFWEHIEDLRKRLIYSLLFFSIGSGAIYPISGKIIQTLSIPVGKTYFFAPQEALFIRIKVSMMFGFVLALPFIIHQLYIFIAPALTRVEKKYIAPLLIAVIAFFYGGVAVAYLIFLPYILKMLLSFQMETMIPLISISKYIGFLMWLLAGFGIAFLMPVFSFLFSKLDILSPSILIKSWRVSIVTILIFAAIITPTIDLVTMMIASIPLFFLYFVSIGASFLARIGR